MEQLSLLDGLPDHLALVLREYAAAPQGRRDNQALYQAAARRAGMRSQDFLEKTPVGRAAQPHSVNARRLRWHQQDLKRLGWLEPVPGQRGQWQLTAKARHLRLIHAGGEGRYRARADGAYTLRPDSFSPPTAGRIPRNVQRFVQSAGDADLKRARQAARQARLPVHGAGMPLGLAEFLVRYLCPPEGLVADPFCGWGTTGFAAELNDRPWVGSEIMGEYLVASAERFARRPGFSRRLA